MSYCERDLLSSYFTALVQSFTAIVHSRLVLPHGYSTQSSYLRLNNRMQFSAPHFSFSSSCSFKLDHKNHFSIRRGRQFLRCKPLPFARPSHLHTSYHSAQPLRFVVACPFHSLLACPFILEWQRTLTIATSTLQFQVEKGTRPLPGPGLRGSLSMAWHAVIVRSLLIETDSYR